MSVASGYGSDRINISYNGEKRVCIYDRVSLFQSTLELMKIIENNLTFRNFVIHNCCALKEAYRAPEVKKSLCDTQEARNNCVAHL